MKSVSREQFLSDVAGKRAGEIRPEVASACAEIWAEVAGDGDRALVRLTERYDGVRLAPDGIEIGDEELRGLAGKVDKETAEAMALAADRIRTFHGRQPIPSSWFMTEPGVVAGQLIRPFDRVGVYAPGGRAPYPSSLLMAAIPAAVAGVKEVVCCTPPQADGGISPLVALACQLAGVTRVFRIGGAQAIAALALGTESIPQVEFICGPGNEYVAGAKRLAVGRVGTDLDAGPSEVAVLADRSARADWVAADLVAQAEHDPSSSVALFAVDEELVARVMVELECQLSDLGRRQVASPALERAVAVVEPDLGRAVELVNAWAPEHVALHVKDPWDLAPSISAAGAVMIGSGTPVAVADYVAGPNHVLPTGGTARYSSPLGCDRFVRRINVLEVTPAGLKRLGPPAIRLAESEGLDGHARSISVRYREDEHGD